ncbi:MAG: pyruvate dehydrogenase (acetyl-transferring) E1 component subunit alpha [Ktedonobacteraceae bacterium]
MTSIMQEQGVRPPEPISVLAPDGSVRPGAQVEESSELLHKMYRWMTFGRIFDTRMLNLHRQGRIITYAPVAGQEAAQIGSSLALRQEDWLFGTYRDGLACMVHGLPAEHILYLFRGHPKAGAAPAGVNVFGQQIGIAEQIPHAVGAAWGMKLRKANTATLALFGDGATSEGAFHEGANFAGVLKAPVVMVCQNNGWAISVPRTSQTASETLAQKAVAYGIVGRLVDGNDVLAMYREVGAALERARAGQGPTLIEALTYRFGPHSASDDPKRYRPSTELAEWQNTRDPLLRLRVYLEHQGMWDETQQKALEEEARAEVARVVTAALTEPVPAPESLFDQVYETASPLLEEQRRELSAYRKATEKGVTFP